MPATLATMSTAETAVPGGARHMPQDDEGNRVGLTVPSVTLDEIYEAHFGFVWRTLRGLGVHSALLDDATQDVFVVVHRQLPRFEGRSTLKTWLCGIALRVAHDYRRSARRRGPSVPLTEANTPSTRPTPLEHAEQAEAARLLQRFLDSLDEAKRAVFVLSELEEMTAPEIAAVVGANINTVYARLRTGRRLFVEAVRRERGANGGTR